MAVASRAITQPGCFCAGKSNGWMRFSMLEARRTLPARKNASSVSALLLQQIPAPNHSSDGLPKPSPLLWAKAFYGSYRACGARYRAALRPRLQVDPHLAPLLARPRALRRIPLPHGAPEAWRPPLKHAAQNS